ncbi:FAD-dependent oxidoreductase [Candidatus Latescibacterota bacterium]
MIYDIETISKEFKNNKKSEMIGSVLVVGAGIAGMQAALDCANAGLKVYLLEEQPSIGGNMARLDKTFPTNDCAMCMISPKLVETGRHLNIDIISYADLVGLEGKAGNFTATIRKRARFVDEDICNGCGDCERECPIEIEDTFNGVLSKRKAVHRLYPQAIPNTFTVDKRELPPPCRATCPAGVNAQGYIGLISSGKFFQALDVVRERMPFAGICGRICHHPCEQNCNRSEIDEPVSIRNLKRFVAEYERDCINKGLSIERPPSEMPLSEKGDYSEKVAVVGGGPAGLTCANDLTQIGYSVTVFDSEKKPGGMMRTTIPEYRLPRDIIDHEIGLILSQGIDFVPEKTFGCDFTLDDLKKNGFDSIFIATGAQLPRKLDIEGSDSNEVMLGIPFLRDINNGLKPEIGEKVVVIGGGNVAMDVARTSQRISEDGNVSIYCLESRNEIPAHEWEVREAEEENININTSWGPIKIISKNGRVEAVEFVKCTSVFDENGRFNPQFDKSEKIVVPADSVIIAIGQSCDLSYLDDMITTERGVITVDKLTLETSMNGVFAGGDIASGPASLVEATAHGHRAAESIHRYLRKLDMREDREPVTVIEKYAEIPEYADYTKVNRIEPLIADPLKRKSTFLEIEETFSEEDAIREAQRCLNCAGCCQCLECVKICKAHAVDHTMTDKQIEVNVGAVVLTTGYDSYDASGKSEYGFGRFANVVTSMQFERILSASGPYEGHLVRPSDGKTPAKIAWIQCVGSRDASIGNDYCSSVCCMYATKEAIIAKEHENDVEPTIFFNDMRAFGKGFEGFYNRARDVAGVRYIQSLISSTKENPENQNLILRYVDPNNGRDIIEEEFDLLVLSTGLVAHHSIGAISELTGISCDRFGFAENRILELSKSNRDGIFLSGAISGPKDIPETVMQSSATAALCGELLQSVRGTEVKSKEYPPERDIDEEEPRIGIFICHCGSNIASVVDVKDVAEYAKSLDGVAFTTTTIYTCSQDTQELIKDTIKEQKLNRVIVASCTPRTHEPLFRETLREAGLNEYLFEMVNIREQCSWVHQKEHELATEKAKSLVRGGVGKSRLLESLRLSTVVVTKAALIVGGGISGMTTSLSLARQDYKVYLVEKEKELGGNLSYIKRTIEGFDIQQFLRQTVDEVNAHENIDVYLNAEIEDVSGFIGNFVTKLKDVPDEIKHGVIVVATGAEEYKPGDFLYGEDERVVTQRDLEGILEGDFTQETVTMIQCVGSRNEEHEYCSRVCCGEAVKNALAIKEKKPEAKVYVLYRDMRMYGLNELYYRKAREKGVVFIRFPDDQYPLVSTRDGDLYINVYDAVLGESIELKTDLTVLSAATVPDNESNVKLSETLKVPLDRDGFFMEAHVKLRPVDFANEGIFVCGMAHSPKFTEENISQAQAVAGRAACILSKDSLEVGGVISVVNQDKCASCLTCVRECVYSAPFINADGKAEIEAAKCQGCGNCVAACPGKAITLRTFTDMQEKALFYSIVNN